MIMAPEPKTRSKTPGPSTELLLVYGGTFDPVHTGHVIIARAAADALGASRVALIPCGDPPHRDAPMASGRLRAELLALAFADDPRFHVDLRELERSGPSFMVDTLHDLRASVGPEAPLALLLGMDAARGLPSWERWEDMPALAHLVLAPRPGDPAMPGEAVERGWSETPVAEALHLRPAGLRFQLPRPLSEASATASRAALAVGQVEAADLPEAVRRRLESGGPYRQIPTSPEQ